jgi:hypothetical protein
MSVGSKYKLQAYHVRFQVLTATSMKITVFWYVAPCSLTKIDRRFRRAYWLHYHRPDDRGSKHLWNVDQFPLDYTAQHPRRQWFSYSSPWDPELPLIVLMMEAVSTSETSVNFYETTRRNNPKDSHLQTIYHWSWCNTQLHYQRIIHIKDVKFHSCVGVIFTHAVLMCWGWRSLRLWSVAYGAV